VVFYLSLTVFYVETLSEGARVSTRISGAAFALAILLDLGFGSAVAQQLPAVSAINGKAEFDAGVLSLPSVAFVGWAAGTITLPVGDRFGI